MDNQLQLAARNATNSIAELGRFRFLQRRAAICPYGEKELAIAQKIVLAAKVASNSDILVEWFIYKGFKVSLMQVGDEEYAYTVKTSKNKIIGEWIVGPIESPLVWNLKNKHYDMWAEELPKHAKDKGCISRIVYRLKKWARKRIKSYNQLRGS